VQLRAAIAAAADATLEAIDFCHERDAEWRVTS